MGVAEAVPPLGGASKAVELTFAAEKGGAPNPLLKKTCAQIGRNRYFEARPAVVHFGGFALGEPCSVRVDIVNVAPNKQRLHLVAPQSAEFRLRGFVKKGAVAPGLAESLIIDFSPTAHRYHYDALRVLCDDGETLLIPIHAYPIMNKVVLPPRLDFGAVALGSVVERRITLKCDVPIAFEYRARALKRHAELSLRSPETGLVPANGAVEVVLRYAPARLGTAVLDVEVEVSQFNSKPQVLTVLGNCVPGLVRQELLQTAAVDFNGAPADDWTSRIDHAAELQKYGGTLPAPVAKATEDTALLLLETSLVERGSVQKAVKPRKAAKPAEVLLEGLRVPADLKPGDQRATNYVLTQTPGKLKPKDLKEAITHQRQRRSAQKTEQDALRALTGGGDQAMGEQQPRLSVYSICAEIVSKPGDRELQELAFLQDLADLATAEADREFKASEEYVGEDLLNEEEVEVICRRRKGAADSNDFARRAEARSRTATQLFSPSAQVAAERFRVAVSVEASKRLATFLTGVTFDCLSQDVWAKRRRSLARFAAAASQVIVRARAGKRLSKIRLRLNGCKDRADVRNLVDNDTSAAAQASGAPATEVRSDAAADGGSDAAKAARAAGVGEPATVETRLQAAQLPHGLFTVGEIRGMRFPRFEAQTAALRETVHCGAVQTFFDDVRPLDLRPVDALRVALDAKRVEAPRMRLHFEATLQRQLRSGAAGESGVREGREVAADWSGRSVFADDVEVVVEPPADAAADFGDAAAVARAAVASAMAAWDADFLADALGLCAATPAEDSDAAMATMPDALTAVVQVDGHQFLRQSRVDVPFARPPSLDEASAAWPLRPQPVPRTQTVNARISTRADAATARAYAAEWPSTSDVWRPRRERRASALSCLAHAYHLRGWNVDAAAPRPLRGPAAEDALSESESDDEASHDAPRPTIRGTRAIFDAQPDDAQADGKTPLRPTSASASRPASAKLAPAAVAAAEDAAGPPEDAEDDEADEADDADAVISDIPRDRARLELSRRDAVARAAAAERLPQNAENILRKSLL